mgnify:FL=1
MRIYIIDKYKAITFALIILLLILGLPLTKNTAINVANPQKEVPIYRVERQDNKIALTFDCAWGADDIDDIIKTLKDENVKCTFFVVGDFLDKYPEAVKKLFDAGHEIANHSDSHAHFNKLNAEQMKKDLDECDRKIRELTGYEGEILFRAPYGEYNNQLMKVCRETNRKVIQWDVDGMDIKVKTKKSPGKGFFLCFLQLFN